MKQSLIVAAIFCLLSPSGAWAQGNSGAENLSSANRRGQSNAASVAQVGAGTTNGSTTGFSGSNSSSAGSTPSLPPLPSAALCSSYTDQPFYRNCLEKLTPRSGGLK